ncbi:MAG: hypothetical protein JXO22_09325 [Phycisphaerae bacterium]|nr:hypothetical protein [Phycisphaerae bacterium]
MSRLATRYIVFVLVVCAVAQAGAGVVYDYASQARAHATTVGASEEATQPVEAAANALCSWGDNGAKSWANIYTGIKAQSWARTPDPLGVGGGADASIIVPFKVTSSNHTEGTMVPVDLDVSLTGTISVGLTGIGTAESSARVSMLTSLKTLPGNVLLSEREGDFEATAFADGSYDTEVEGDLDGAVGGSGGTYNIYFAETVSFTGCVGSVYRFYFDLGSGVSYMANSGSATSATAEADFYNTGLFALSSTDPDVGFLIIPEPSAFVLLVAVVGLMRQR